MQVVDGGVVNAGDGDPNPAMVQDPANSHDAHVGEEAAKVHRQQEGRRVEDAVVPYKIATGSSFSLGVTHVTHLSGKHTEGLQRVDNHVVERLR